MRMTFARRCFADISADIRGGMPIAWLVPPSACAEGISGNVNILGNSSSSNFVTRFRRTSRTKSRGYARLSIHVRRVWWISTSDPLPLLNTRDSRYICWSRTRAKILIIMRYIPILFYTLPLHALFIYFLKYYSLCNHYKITIFCLK